MKIKMIDLAYISVFLIVTGTLIGAYVTINFREKTKKNLKENLKISEDTQDFLTAGNSYPFIDIIRTTPYANDESSNDGDTWRLCLRLVGENTIRDLTIEIFDRVEERRIEENNRGFDMTDEQIETFKFRPKINLLAPSDNPFIEETINSKLLKRDRDYLNIYITFKFGNKVYEENLKVINLWSGGDKIAISVKKDNEVIFERTEGDDFPRLENGNFNFSVQTN